MSKITYFEAIAHVRKYKNFYRVGAIADCMKMNQGQLRQVINRKGYAQELPERYRAEFTEIVNDLCKVQQIDSDGSNHEADEYFRGVEQ